MGGRLVVGYLINFSADKRRTAISKTPLYGSDIGSIPVLPTNLGDNLPC